MSLFDFVFQLLQMVVDAFRRHPRIRNMLVLVALVVLFLHVFFVVIPPAVTTSTIIFLVVGILSLSDIRFTAGSIAAELEPLRREREAIQRRMETDKQPDVLDTIQLSLNQLTEYYTINKSQARSSFQFSVFAVVVGLLTLIGGISIFALGKNPNLTRAAVTGIGGTIAQFIGGAYFYLYNKSLAQLNYFYDQLVKIQHTMLSVKLCEQIQDPGKQLEVREKLITALISQGIGTAARPAELA